MADSPTLGIQRLTYYQATDKKIFDNETDCLAYQNTIDSIEQNIFFFDQDFKKTTLRIENYNSFHINIQDYYYIKISTVKSWDYLINNYTSNIDNSTRPLPDITDTGHYYFDDCCQTWKRIEDEVTKLQDYSDRMGPIETV